MIRLLGLPRHTSYRILIVLELVADTLIGHIWEDVSRDDWSIWVYESIFMEVWRELYNLGNTTTY